MLKKVLLLILVLSLISVPSIFAATTSSVIKVYIDGEKVSFKFDPVIEKGSTLVQFRPLFEKLGLTIVWDEKTKTIESKNDHIVILLTIGQQTAIVNGEKYNLDVAPKIVDGNTIVPLRFVSESLKKGNKVV